MTRTAAGYRDDAEAPSRLRPGITGLRDVARELASADARDVVERFGQIGRRRFTLVA